VYCSVDIDGLDPGFAPGTGTMEPFGLAPREARDLVRAVAPAADGFDVVEVNDRDDGQAAALAGKLLREFVQSHAAAQGRVRPVRTGSVPVTVSVHRRRRHFERNDRQHSRVGRSSDELGYFRRWRRFDEVEQRLPALDNPLVAASGTHDDILGTALPRNKTDVGASLLSNGSHSAPGGRRPRGR